MRTAFLLVLAAGAGTAAAQEPAVAPQAPEPAAAQEPAVAPEARGPAVRPPSRSARAAAARGERPGPYHPTDRYRRLAGVDVLHYDISLDLPASGKLVSGRTGIVVEAVAAPLSTLPLDFAALTVDSVRAGGTAAPFRHEGGRLEVSLPPLAPGARTEVVVWYHGEPEDGLVLEPRPDGRPAAFADNWPDRARFWFPGVDHPSDKATVDFTIEAPAEMEVVANGYLRDVTDLGNGRERTRWSATAELPTYCMVIGATDFAVTTAGRAAGVEVTHWTLPADSAAGAAAFARSVEILAFYDSLFGPYPYEKLAHVQSATRFGAMENASAIFYSREGIAAAGRGAPGVVSGRPGAEAAPTTDTSLSTLVAHETVHQWFGDAVTEADWHHLWLSEGFADYFAAVFFEMRGGPEGRGPAELRRRMAEAASNAIARWHAEGDPILDPDRTDYMGLLNENNYDKAAWVLHMLRAQVGDEAFFRGIRDFYAAYRDGTAWTADFQRVMEEASGLELGWFFDQWIRRPGHPVLAVSLEREGPDRGRVTVRQVQPGEPFRFPLDLELGWRTGTRRERVVVEGSETTWRFDTPDPIETVVLDPDGWLLHEEAAAVR
jgi:aminopeptidase N